jgi:hypothetical protein
MTNCTLSVRVRSKSKSQTAQTDKYETKNNQPCRREGAGKFSQRNVFAEDYSFSAEWPPTRSSWYAVVGITPRRSQFCRTAEPVITATHLLLFTTGCFLEVATLVPGAANADAQKAIDNATAAHRTDQPHKPLNFVTVVIEKVSVLSRVKASENTR